MSLAGMRSSSSVHKGSTCDDFMSWAVWVVELLRSLAKSFTTRMIQFLCCTCRMRPIKPAARSYLIPNRSILHSAWINISWFQGRQMRLSPSFTHVTKVLSRVLFCTIWQFRPFHFIWRSLAVVLPRWKVRFAINFKRRSSRQFVAVGFEFVA